MAGCVRKNNISFQVSPCVSARAGPGICEIPTGSRNSCSWGDQGQAGELLQTPALCRVHPAGSDSPGVTGVPPAHAFSCSPVPVCGAEG